MARFMPSVEEIARMWCSAAVARCGPTVADVARHLAEHALTPGTPRAGELNFWEAAGMDPDRRPVDDPAPFPEFWEVATDEAAWRLWDKPLDAPPTYLDVLEALPKLAAAGLIVEVSAGLHRLVLLPPDPHTHWRSHDLQDQRRLAGL